MNICANCHFVGNGCCFVRKDDEKNMFGLTLSEIKKIQELTKLQQSEFIITDVIEKDFSQEIKDFDEIFGNVFINNNRFRLRTIDRKCVFLMADGCKLPSKIRPYYCRLYPFWVVADELILLGSEQCEVMKYKDDINIVLEKLKTNKNDIKKIYYQYLESSKAHKKIIESIYS